MFQDALKMACGNQLCVPRRGSDQTAKPSLEIYGWEGSSFKVRASEFIVMCPEIWIDNCLFFSNTPWKFNIAPENKPSQKDSSLPTIIFQGLC